MGIYGTCTCGNLFMGPTRHETCGHMWSLGLFHDCGCRTDTCHLCRGWVGYQQTLEFCLKVRNVQAWIMAWLSKNCTSFSLNVYSILVLMSHSLLRVVLVNSPEIWRGRALNFKRFQCKFLFENGGTDLQHKTAEFDIHNFRC